MKLKILLLVCAMLVGCKTDTAKLASAPKTSVSIIHDNDRTLDEWLQAAIAGFQPELAASFPDKEFEISLIQESNSQAIEDVSSGKKKADAILLPHPDFAKVINDNLINLGSPVSSCSEIIASPFVAIVPKSQLQRLSDILTRPVEQLTGDSVDVSSKELAQLIRSSSFSYSHPARSARGQLALLLSLGTINSKFFSNLNPGPLDFQKSLEWYAPSDSLLIKHISRQGSAENKSISLGLISKRQLNLRNELKESYLVLNPRDKTIWESQTFCISEADWVNPVKKSVLLKLQEHLRSDASINFAKEKGFVPVLTDRPLSPPAIQLSESKRELLHETVDLVNKPFALALAIDTSATIPQEALGQIQEYVERLFAQSPAKSKIDLISFSSEVQVIGDRTSLSTNLRTKLSDLRPAGGSAIYDALLKQYEILSMVPSSDYRRVAVLITDGTDRNSETTVEEINALVSDPQKTNGFVSLFIVAVAQDQSTLGPLTSIADMAGGVLYEAETKKLFEALVEIQDTL